MIQLSALMKACVQHQASDIHLRVGRPPALRHHGKISNLQSDALQPDDTERLVREILPSRLAADFESSGTADFAISYEDQARFRVSAFVEKGRHALVLRLIPQKIRGFEEIGLPTSVIELLDRPRGLVLVTGPTGSGKTTTLAAMVDHININQSKHIITIEDPIEYYHPHKTSIVTQREVGSDTPDFAEAMRRALRQDPDVVMLGEMRDQETISTAITAAETGHLVFGTLHTTGSARTVDRIIDSFSKEQQEQIRTQLAMGIVAVISQILVPRRDGGIRAAFEVMINTPAIENYIRKSETFKIASDIQTGKKRGMVLLDDYLLRLCREGEISTETAIEYAQDRNEMRSRLT